MTPRPLPPRGPASSPSSTPAIYLRGSLFALLALAAVLFLPACAKKGGRGGFQMPPTPVEVAAVQTRTVRDQFRAVGTIESDESIKVVSELSLPVSRIRFAEGMPVARGAVLAQLDDRELSAIAQRAEAQREQAQSNAERARKLFEQHAISEQQLDDARTALKVAEADESLAKTRLQKTRIVAPFAGLVGRRLVSPGAYLQSGDAITELARIDEMKVAFSAPERYLSELKPGVPVTVTSPAVPNRAFSGRLTVVVPIVDANTRTVQLVARIPNPQRLLRPGMSADVSVTFSERPNSLVVPDQAVFAEGNQVFVYVVKPDSTVARTAITIGSRDSMRVEVTQGLAPGSTVVSAGHQKLFDGARVMPISDQPQASGPGGAAPGRPGAGGPSASRTGASSGKAEAAPAPGSKGRR